MTYRVVLIKSEEGYAAFCPALPGCVSQGTTEREALDNIREAAALWLDAGGAAVTDSGGTAEADLLREAADESLEASVHEISLVMVA